jgi:hypothetical protein
MLSSEVPSKAAWRDVFFTRCDGRHRSELVEGTSLNDAAFRALEQAVRFWRFDAAAPIIVRELKQLAGYWL